MHLGPLAQKLTPGKSTADTAKVWVFLLVPLLPVSAARNTGHQRGACIPKSQSPGGHWGPCLVTLHWQRGHLQTRGWAEPRPGKHNLRSTSSRHSPQPRRLNTGSLTRQAGGHRGRPGASSSATRGLPPPAPQDTGPKGASSSQPRPEGRPPQSLTHRSCERLPEETRANPASFLET